MYISNLLTGHTIPCELVKETKCYYTVSYVMHNGRTVEERFNKSTMTIDWQYIALRV